MRTLYITDLDGTFLRSDETLSPFSADIAARITAQGDVFSYATGRSLVSASSVTGALDAQCPVVVYNGTFIMNSRTGEVLHSNTFTDEACTAIRVVLDEHGANPLVFAFVDGAERMSWLRGAETLASTVFLDRREGDPRRRPVDTAEELYEGEMFCFTFSHSEEAMRGVCKVFENSPYAECLYLRDIYSGDYWCELMHPQAGKANAVRELARITDCGKIVCFGDNANDISMFEIADEAYAVSNAVSELKALATGVIGSNDDDAVARWLLENAII